MGKSKPSKPIVPNDSDSPPVFAVEGPFVLPGLILAELPRAQVQHLDWLERENSRHNLTRVPLEDWAERHVLDSVAPLFAGWQVGHRCLDLGTGAGFPGVPLAAHSAECHVSLLECKAKVGKLLAEFLAASSLVAYGAVLIGRAETLAHDPIYRAQYDTVITRAVAALPVLIELGIPFLDEGGELWCWKSSLEELVDSERALAELNATPVRALRYRLPSEDHDRFVIALRRTGSFSGRYPRKDGIPAKRPLGGRTTSK